MGALSAGCDQQTGGLAPRRPDPARIKTEPAPPAEKNVIRVYIFAPAEPWVSFDPEGDPTPGGLRFSLFLEPGGSSKAVYGDGIIEINLYRMVSQRGGKPQRELVRTWEFTPEQALPYLLRRPTAYGWAYGMRLSWGDAKLAGQDIQVVPRFIRRDGQIVPGRPLSLKVPRA